MRFAAFDIETTALEATYGRPICACFKFLDEKKVRTFSMAKLIEEPSFLEKVKESYEEADVLVTWNGKMFDIPFIQARLAINNIPVLEPMKHIDLLYQGKKLRTRGSRLEGMSKDLNLVNQKYSVPGTYWPRAAEGDKKAIAEIVKHCEQDVLITEEMFGRLKDMIVRITK